MNQIQTFQKLVDLLGHSENDPELQALFIELGEKFPLNVLNLMKQAIYWKIIKRKIVAFI